MSNAAQCAAEMRQIAWWTSDICPTIQAMDLLVGPDTWQSSAAEQFRHDWASARAQILAALADAESQGGSLIARAEQAAQQPGANRPTGVSSRF